MSFFDTIRIALRALLKNKMRAVLTIIGVVIGIAAVTTIVSIGQGASALVSGEFESLASWQRRVPTWSAMIKTTWC